MKPRSVHRVLDKVSTAATQQFAAENPLKKKLEGWLSLVESTRLEIERRVKPTVGSNPTPSAISSIAAQADTPGPLALGRDFLRYLK